jgi:hypothetical protein
MKTLMILAATTAMVGLILSGQPARSDDDCDTVLKSLKEGIDIATKNFDASMEDLKKSMTPDADDKKKAAIRNHFCSISGEYLGTTRAFRAVTAACGEGGKQNEALASLDGSIKQIEASLDSTCK